MSLRTLLRREPVEGKPPVIMFDFDGVIADSFEVFYEEFSAAVHKIGFDKISSRESLLTLMEGNLFQSLIKIGFPIRKLRALGREFQPRIEAANARVQPFPGMPELLADLAAAWPTYVITSNQSAAIDHFLDRYNIQGIRDVLGADKEPSKVKKIRKVLRKHKDCTPWYIGDTKGDMLEGNEAGAITVAVTWGWHKEPKMLEGKPGRVVRTPKELRALFL